MAVTSSPASSLPPAIRRAGKAHLASAILAGFVATTAMAVVAMLGYFVALGLGNPAGDTFTRWLDALTHNPITQGVRSSLLGTVGLDLAAGMIWAMLFAFDANDRLIVFPGWVRGLLFALPPYLLSLIVFLPLVGGGFLGQRLGAGPLPIIGTLVLHLVYGMVLGAMYTLEDDRDCGRPGDPAIQRTLAHAEMGAAYGIVLGALIGGGGTSAIMLLVATYSATTMIGAAIGGAVIGAALGLAFGSMIALTDIA